MFDDRLIIALDFSNLDDAKNIVYELDDSVSFYKVGMELFYSAGSTIVTWLKSQKKSVFLDLKLHDIPNTVGKALSSLLYLQPDIINVHASGGYDMMCHSVETLQHTANRLGIVMPKLIAVTVLTSIGQKSWLELGHKDEIETDVIRLALLAKKAGLQGVVSSPNEASKIKQACGNDFLIITPGIRLVDSLQNDQSRITTPEMAIANGATHLVVGRPVTSANDPKIMVKNILKNMRGVKRDGNGNKRTLI